MPIKNWWVDKLRIAVAVGYTTLLTIASLISISGIPAAHTAYADKLFHIGAYFVLSFLWMFIVHSTLKITFIALLIITYGIIIEFLQQQFTVDRSLDLYDMLANLIGVIIAVILVISLSRKKNKLEKR
ncbi:hypothetical protein GCM10009117_06270 [Gangjinia marincola]|uniref:VanZ-like domain-containing protein n=1 Tax=Gangjinia marincola TaxID=578463 RepID=A0ABN1MEF5_9FLAO